MLDYSMDVTHLEASHKEERDRMKYRSILAVLIACIMAVSAAETTSPNS